ncbi:hypothetical protein WKT22_03736 [Candidatus Lokiarchaeum ossiferum]
MSYSSVITKMVKKSLWILRIIFCLMGWIILIYDIATSKSLFLFLFYTIQSNFLVAVWLLLAILWDRKPEKYQKLTGLVRGGITLYITVTFLIFAILLAPLMPPDYAFDITNILFHYLIPVYFIVDWFLTERDTRYKWNYLPKWLIYPISYLILTLIYGLFTGFYPYFFIDPSSLGVGPYILSILGMTAFYLILGSIFIGINRKFTQNYQI